MALEAAQEIISADDHMDIHVLPADVFQKRLPKSFQEQGPRVVETETGPFWQAEGGLISPSGSKGKGYLSDQDHGFRPGDPASRLEDMDRDGVLAQVVYSPMTTQLRIGDAALRAACMAAYNDWASEFNRYDPRRLLLLAHIPGHDPIAARDELIRVARMGHKGAIIGQDEGVDPIFEDAWHPFWDVAEEYGLPIHAHLGPRGTMLKAQLGSWRMPAFVASIPMQLDETLCGMVFSGILETRPNVKLVLGEAGLGWIPYMIERMDHEYEKYYEKVDDHRLEIPPSEIFRRQIFVTYEDESIGVKLIPEIGVDNVMWASDYPHGDSTWPHSRQAIASSPLASHGDEILRKVVRDNAAAVYGVG
jgi:predicted TIM-barrel fold metal-dependent hydrolase